MPAADFRTIRDLLKQKGFEIVFMLFRLLLRDPRVCNFFLDLFSWRFCRRRKQLEELNFTIQEETEKVREELSGVEPAVQDAKQAVRSINKQHLVEIKSMNNPPAGEFVAFFL